MRRLRVFGNLINAGITHVVPALKCRANKNKVPPGLVWAIPRNHVRSPQDVSRVSRVPQLPAFFSLVTSHYSLLTNHIGFFVAHRLAYALFGITQFVAAAGAMRARPLQ